jgi:DNA-binding NtrC family response regulator
MDRTGVHVRLLHSDGTIREVVVGAGESVLVGRKPQADRLALTGPASEAVRTVTLTAPNVSENHLLLRSEQGALAVTDLGSRNGTWPKMPAGVSVAFSVQELTLELGRPGNGEAADSGMPEEPRYRSPVEFPEAVGRAVHAWLQRLDEDVEVVVGKDEGTRVQDLHAIPLPRGSLLHLRPRATVSPSWPTSLATLWRYVETQSRVFDTEEDSRLEGMILASDIARHTHREVIEAAARGHRVLLLGPSGVGKEGLARAYHRHSGRTGRFVALNCAELSRELLRAELFGAEQGAFTGSVRRIAGVVEQANGGTLFLDEIGEMPLDIQPMLLRFLDRGEYTAIGRYGQSQHADVRMVCATNRDLRADAREGRFRQDLWFRLSTQVVRVPGLRERSDDLLAYLDARPMPGAGSLLHALSADALTVLRNHAWEGNFRELANFVERLPCQSAPAGIDARTCRDALERGSLATPSAARSGESCLRPSGGGTATWTAWSEQALQAYVEDHDGQAPATWDDVQSFVEKYFKPLVMVHLGGAAGQIPADAAGVQRLARGLADVLRADRGTAAKQLSRFVERYLPERAS